MFSGVKVTNVTAIKPGLINKSSYVVTTSTISGVSVKMTFTPEKMNELLQSCGMTKPEELMRRTVAINSKNQFAILPEDAELTIAVRTADGKLMELDFQNT